MNSKSNSVNQREDIIEALRKHPEGLTLRDISEIVGHHRHTITKYVYELIGANVIYQRDVGAAKLCYLRESYNGDMKREERKIFKNLGKGQAQLIALFVLLLLLPATVIVAQNMTNSSNGLAGMVTGLNLTLNESNGDALRDAIQEGPPDILSNVSGAERPINESAPGSEESNQNLTGSNASLPDIGGDDEPIINETGNETNATLPDGLPISNETNLTVANATFHDTNETNVTVPNATAPAANETNMTIPNETMPMGPIENVTGINETLNITENVTTTDENITKEPQEPEIVVDIITPDKITRGGEFELFAVVDNTGESVAGNVQVEWTLPGFLTVISGDIVHDCGDISPLYTCTSAITVFADGDASLGLSEVNVRVDYVK